MEEIVIVLVVRSSGSSAGSSGSAGSSSGSGTSGLTPVAEEAILRSPGRCIEKPLIQSLH